VSVSASVSFYTSRFVDTRHLPTMMHVPMLARLCIGPQECSFRWESSRAWFCAARRAAPGSPQTACSRALCRPTLCRQRSVPWGLGHGAHGRATEHASSQTSAAFAAPPRRSSACWAGASTCAARPGGSRPPRRPRALQGRGRGWGRGWEVGVGVAPNGLSSSINRCLHGTDASATRRLEGCSSTRNTGRAAGST